MITTNAKATRNNFLIIEPAQPRPQTGQAYILRCGDNRSFDAALYAGFSPIVPRKQSLTTRGSQTAFRLKTLFMGSDGTVPEHYARATEKKHLSGWLAEGLIEHRPAEKLYALTPQGETRIR